MAENTHAHQTESPSLNNVMYCFDKTHTDADITALVVPLAMCQTILTVTYQLVTSCLGKFDLSTRGFSRDRATAAP